MMKKIFIAGSGGIGEAAALLLREWSETETEIYLGDVIYAGQKILFCKTRRKIPRLKRF
jgi:malate/lactate dehydrogenase